MVFNKLFRKEDEIYFYQKLIQGKTVKPQKQNEMRRKVMRAIGEFFLGFSKHMISALSLGGLMLLYWLWLPTLSVAYLDGFAFLSICIITVSVNVWMWASNFSRSEMRLWQVPTAAVVAFVVILIVGIIIGGPWFNDDTMYRQLGDVEKVEFDEMIKQIDISQIPIVDEELAKKQADKKIGEDIALGSRVELGKPSIQEVNGELIFVAPLEHSSPLKWWANRTTPGYITVSASNPNKVNYVTEIDGEKIQIRYQTSAILGKDLKRYIREHGYRNIGLTEYTFELNDEGRPYWVVTTYENQILWGCPEATGVVVVDAQTGEINWYPCEGVPKWVDIVQPEEFVDEQINNWGEYVRGWWNPADTDKIKKTDRTIPVFVEDDCYYFTGMTSVGKDDSCVGFIMVNTRNKKAVMSYMSGATEDAAMKSAEGLVQNFGYEATEPTPVNINGIPSYVVPLKDTEKLIKSCAIVNVTDYSIAVNGNTLEEARRKYIQRVAETQKNQVIGSDEAYGYTYTGVVERISSVVENGSTYYYFILKDKDEIFTAPASISNELAITREGDTVKIEYIDDKNSTVDITSFDNVAFATPTSESQGKRDEFDKGSSALDSKYNQIIQVNPDLSQETWNSLTEEEKAKMLDEYLKKNNLG